MTTVYLDTSFWIALGKEPEPVADRVVEALNELGVRPVVSTVHLSELLQYPKSGDVDRRIVACSEGFRAGLLDLTKGANGFRMLLAPDELRQPLAGVVRLKHEMAGKADALSLSARKGEAAPPGSLESAPNDWETFVRPFCRSVLGLEIPPLDRLESMGETDRTALASAARELLPEAVWKQLEAGDRMKDAVSHDPRAGRVAAGTASAKEGKAFGATLRDAEHMTVFVEHQDQIELLHVDGPRYRQLQDRADHYLRQLQLEARCFEAPRPDAVPSAITRSLKNLETKTGQ